jgi:uncharacterized protein YcbK (DUF882 family)
MKNFKLSEFACKCCGKTEMNEKTLEMVDKARDIANIPFYVSSGYRCEPHNRSVGGVQGSSHTKGYAVDIKCHSEASCKSIEKAAREAGFTRIGIASNFVHMDNDPDKPQNVTWRYK